MEESTKNSAATVQTKPSYPAASARTRTFEQFLIDEKYLTKKQAAESHLHQVKEKQSLEQALLALKIFDEEKLTRAQAAFFRLPYVDLRTQDIPKNALKILTKETLENYQFLPFASGKNTLKVALTDPTDLRALEALEFLAQQNKNRIELYLTSPGSYRAALQKSKNISSEVSEALQVMEQKEKVRLKPESEEEVETAKNKIVSEAPISRIVDVVIKHAIEARASDIHIEPQEHDLRIRYRIDGILRSSLVVPRVVHPAIVSRIKILSNLKIDEQRLPQDGRFHMNIEKSSIDFRVSTLPTVNGEKVVMRILDKSGGVPTLEELGLSGMKLDRLLDDVKKSHGMVLVTGPTGSGKSTTLYAVLNILNKIGVNIVTLEDPVEYYVDGVNQSQVNPDIGLTFASGLRSILRQDPNIIMVGEIRDRETAELAVHSALTGHLVFSTLHTNDAVGGIARLLDMGIEAFLLTASSNAIMAQRLVRRLCRHCRREAELPDKLKKMFEEKLKNIPEGEKEGVDLSNLKIYESEGCAECGQKSYLGRIGIYEVLPLSPVIKKMIIEHKSDDELQKQAVAEGMITMMQDGLIKVLKGITSIEEILRVTRE